MKKQIQKICNSLSIALIVLSSQSKLIAQERYTLDNETLSVIQKNYPNQSFKIYPVISKETEYYPLVSGEVNTKEYETLLGLKSKYKPEYDKYKSDKVKDSVYRLAIQNIIYNIDKYLNSKDKLDFKEKYLIDAQSLADKHNIVITGQNNSLFAKQLNEHGIIKNDDKEFVLYNGKKVSSKKDIDFYRKELQKIKTPSIEISYGAKNYLKLLDEEKTINKTEIGQVRSDTKSKKSKYYIIETPLEVNILIGNLEKLPNEYYLITEDVKDKYQKNELTTENKLYNENYKTDRFSIVQKIGTDEMYYIMSDQFLFQIGKEAEKKRYMNMSNSTEYKAWKTKYLGLLASAQTDVNSCKSIISKHTYKNIYGEKLYDSSTFSSQEKATFNKNLEQLERKLQEIKELEKNKELYHYYNDKASIEDSVKSYNLSTFFNETNRVY